MLDGEFKRKDNLFSLCGLNCSLCPNFIRKTCIGCRAGSVCALTCEFAPCSIEHGNVTYCYECGQYPCDKYDSLISHLNQLKDMEKAKRIGIENYHRQQRAKIKILEKLLMEYDDGRRDVFFCLACNLMEIDDLTSVVNKPMIWSQNLDLKDKSSLVVEMLNECALKRGITLKLRKGKW